MKDWSPRRAGKSKLASEVLANRQAENGVFIDPTETSTYTLEDSK